MAATKEDNIHDNPMELNNNCTGTLTVRWTGREEMVEIYCDREKISLLARSAISKSKNLCLKELLNSIFS